MLLTAPASPAAIADEEIDPLISALKSNNAEQQIEAAVELGAWGPYASPAVPDLIAGLKSDNQAVQFECAIALGEIGLLAGDAESALVNLLDHDSVDMRENALVSLRRISATSSSTVGKVRQLATSDDLPVAAAALRLLAATDNLNAAQRRQAIPKLLQCITDGHSDTGRNAVKALAVIGEDAVAAVTPVLDSGERTAVLRACVVLAEIGPAAAPATQKLLGLAQSDDPLIVRVAAETLGEIGAQPQAVVPVLTGLLESADHGVRADAADAIGRLGRVANSACGALCQALQDESVIVRTSAASAIGRVSEGDPSTTQHLIEAIEDKQGSVTVSAANALADIGSPAVPALLKLLDDSDYRPLAISVLGEMGQQAADAVPQLVQLLNSEDETLQREVYIALASIGPAAEAASDSLKEIVSGEGSAQQRAGAAWVLGRIGDESAVSTILKVLRSTDDEVLQRACAWAVVTLEPDNPDYARAAVPVLAAALKSDQELVRSECLNALGSVGAPAQSVLDQIVDVAQSDSSAAVRAAALHTMGLLKADSLEAKQASLSALQDSDVAVRNAARFMIGSLGERASAAAPELLDTMRTGEPFEKIVAAWALVRVTPSDDHKKAAAPFMVAALQNADPRVRQEAASTLGTIGQKTPEVLTALKSAATDENADVADAAKAALGKLGG